MLEKLNNILPKLAKERKILHQNPELGGVEFETSKRILNYLKTNCKGKAELVAETGVMITFEFDNHGPTILLRADIDALPIQETNDFDHQSKNSGVSHKCGHDGHTVMMLGVAEMLSNFPLNTGKIILIFQPAEENGMGAKAILAAPQFKDLEIDYVFALHNLPQFPKHQIVLKENNFNANVKSLIIKYNGKTAHAAEPEQGFNPSLAIAETLQFCAQITKNEPAAADFFLITPIHIKMGELAYGVSAGKGELHLTIRSWDLDLFDKKCNELQDFIETSCKKHQLKPTYGWTQVFYANQNNNSAVALIRKAAKANNFDIHEMTYPFKWGEDFGLFTQQYKGAMFGLGAGENTPALHNPDYDFPDDITTTGIQQFYQVLKEITQS